MGVQSEISEKWAEFGELALKNAEHDVVVEFEKELASGQIDREIDQMIEDEKTLWDKILEYFIKD